MYAPAESVIHPDNRELIPQLFALEERGVTEQFRRVANAVIGVYSEVAGVQLSPGIDYPEVFLSLGGTSFEYRFGIPKLPMPARVDGKLFGHAVRMSLPDEKVLSIGFRMDTNDTDGQGERPPESMALAQKFDLALKELADGELSDISVPVPYVHIFYYRPERSYS